MALSVMPNAEANFATLPKRETACSVFMQSLKHTLRDEVKCTWQPVRYAYRMSTLEERVLEVLDALDAAGLKPLPLSVKMGISKQAIYDWRNGKSLKQMRAENLIALSSLSGYEATWIITGRGPKKKMLSNEQEHVLSLMQESEEKQKIITDLVDVVIPPKRLGDERRQRERTISHQDRRKAPWKYNKGGE